MSQGWGGGGLKSAEKVSHIIWMAPKVSMLLNFNFQVVSYSNPPLWEAARILSEPLKQSNLQYFARINATLLKVISKIIYININII